MPHGESHEGIIRRFIFYITGFSILWVQFSVYVISFCVCPAKGWKWLHLCGHSQHSARVGNGMWREKLWLPQGARGGKGTPVHVALALNPHRCHAYRAAQSPVHSHYTWMYTGVHRYQVCSHICWLDKRRAQCQGLGFYYQKLSILASVKNVHIANQ